LSGRKRKMLKFGIAKTAAMAEKKGGIIIDWAS